MVVVTRSRIVIKADSGDICLTPFWAGIGDVILHLLGCGIAVVLRKCEDGGYKFIGEYYIYGKSNSKMTRPLEKKMIK
jgi:hypothetical protein